MGRASLSDEQIIAALRRSKGLVATAARSLGASHHTILRRAEQSPAVKEALDEERAIILDVGELALFRNVKRGEPWAVCFLLKTVGKSRGYVERTEQEITGKDGGALTIRVVYDDANHLLAAPASSANAGDPGSEPV